MEIQSNQKTEDKTAVLSPPLATITLNINELNLPIKRQSSWMN